MASLAWRDYRQFENAVLVERGTLTLFVESGETLSTLVSKLDRLGLDQRDWRWRLAGRLHRPSIQAGEYRIEAGASRLQVLARLARGEVVRHRFTIIEGWTLARLRRALAEDSRLVQHVPELPVGELMQRLGCENCFAEGWFLPETYQFARGDRDLDLLARSYRAMGRELDRAWHQRDPALPLATPEELLILASLVEMESMIDRERAQVAGVFIRRLQRGMRLQTHPTVVYGLDDDFDGRIRTIHLRTDHPWNTYTRHGLPPTP
ncbi:MAG: endolytic transglycosylase MltG, partial [Wenzhouxiangellaceae bacterium]